jgi:hypothetical protein
MEIVAQIPTSNARYTPWLQVALGVIVSKAVLREFFHNAAHTMSTVHGSLSLEKPRLHATVESFILFFFFFKARLSLQNHYKVICFYCSSWTRHSGKFYSGANDYLPFTAIGST